MARFAVIKNKIQAPRCWRLLFVWRVQLVWIGSQERPDETQLVLQDQLLWRYSKKPISRRTTQGEKHENSAAAFCMNQCKETCQMKKLIFELSETEPLLWSRLQRPSRKPKWVHSVAVFRFTFWLARSLSPGATFTREKSRCIKIVSQD